ncbi:MAG: hypothetical protein OSB67_02180 [Alphaproteobacteria bacterium]|nr:hypothetical protein [Alphaproteobacteria bacterium]
MVVYLGYHKTASKWIWQHLFVERYSSAQVNLYEQSVDDIFRRFGSTGGPLILRQRIESGSLGAELPALAEVIDEKFPEARIVIGIRSQKSMLASHYGQYVANGGRLGFTPYLLKTVESKWHYYDFLAPLLKIFGDRVLVYLFEDLRDDSCALLCRIRDFVGEPPNGLLDDEISRIAKLPPLNPQRNDLTIDMMLLLNRLRMRHEKNAIIPELRRPGHDHILVEIVEFFGRKYREKFGRSLKYRRYDDQGVLDEVYAEENQKLSALLGRTLSDYGYPAQTTK